MSGDRRRRFHPRWRGFLPFSLLLETALVLLTNSTAYAASVDSTALQLTDPKLFEKLTKADSVSVYGRMQRPFMPCSFAFHEDSSLLDCQMETTRLPTKYTADLLRCLAGPGLTWVRERGGVPVDMQPELGLRFGRASTGVQMLIDADNGKGRGKPFAIGRVVLWAPRQGAVRADVPGILSGTLMSYVENVLWICSAPPTAAQRDSTSDAPWYVNPDCTCGPMEFVYFEEPATIREAPPPRRPPNVAVGTEVILSVQVGKNGEVCAIRASKGEGEFRAKDLAGEEFRVKDIAIEAAVNAVKGWKYRPAMVSQKPTCVWITVPVKF